MAHNARYDWTFVAAELRRTRDVRLHGTRLCTVRLARKLVPAAESCSLGALNYFFSLENPARHRAAGDALVTALLLQRLMLLARDAGARTLTELEVLQGASRRKRKKRRGGRSNP